MCLNPAENFCLKRENKMHKMCIKTIYCEILQLNEKNIANRIMKTGATQSTEFYLLNIE